MAVEKSRETLSLTVEERTCGLTIETPKGGVFKLHVMRELVKSDEKGNVVSRVNCEPVTKYLDGLKGDGSLDLNETVEISGGKISVGQIIEALPLFFDRWAE